MAPLSIRAGARISGPSFKKDGRSSSSCQRKTRRRSFRGLVEVLESRVLLHANSVLDAEHLAIFGARDPNTGVITGGLVPDSSVSYISVASPSPEKWSDLTTWRYVGPAPADGSQPSPIPGAGANVLISLGSVVIVDGQFNAPLHTIRDDGMLRFDPHANTLLSVDTLIVEQEGTFQMGTDPSQADPLSPTKMGQRIDADKTAQVIFTDTGPIDLNWDPFQYSRGLVSHGEVSIFGSTVTSYEQLVVDAKAHDTTLVLAAKPTGWKVGDRLVLTGDTATDANGVNHDEEVQIASIGLTADGHTSVTIIDPTNTNAPSYPKGDFNLDQAVTGADILAASRALSNLRTFQTSHSLSDADLRFLADVNGDGQITNADLTTLLKLLKQGTQPASTLWTGLQFDHPVISGYVADVTRNATFASQNVTTISERGQVMFMHNDDVHVDAAGFYGLGRTDKRIPIDDPVLSPDPDHPGKFTTDKIDPTTGQRVIVPVLDANGKPVVINGTAQMQPVRTGLNPRGRYAVHFHRTGVDEGSDPATIADSSVVDTPGWGIVNHSSNVDVDGNVVFNAVGAAYATEAGDEIGRFDGNIAIHSVGSGMSNDSRSNVQDFGHAGNGFWLQGGNVSVTNNIVAGQRAAGFVFYSVGLDQAGLGATKIPVDDLVDQSWAAPGQTMVGVQTVPLRKFDGDIAFACDQGLQIEYTLQGVDGQHADQRNIIENFTTFDDSRIGISTFYSGWAVFKNVNIIGNETAPYGTGISNTVDSTRNFVFDHVHVVGWEIGVNSPGIGNNEIDGGYFNDVTGILIGPETQAGRIVKITGNTDNLGHPDLSQPQFGTLSATALGTRKQMNIDQTDTFGAGGNDIPQLFNQDQLRAGMVMVNGQQLYFREQASNYIPFSSSASFGSPANVPPELVDQTNQQIYTKYGLAIGNFLAPVTAAASDPRISGLLGPSSATLAHLQLVSTKYVNGDTVPYFLSYKYYNPSDPKANAYGYVSVTETTPTTLKNGWNLIQRTILGANRTLLVYGDDISPTFVLSPGMPSTISRADIKNGAEFTIVGRTLDDSFGSRLTYETIKLNDVTHVSTIQSDSNGSYIVLSFTIADDAGNATLVSVRFSVIDKSTNPTNQNNILPPLMPSVTLQALLSKKI